MKPMLLISLLSVLLCSCAPYQYFALSGDGINKENNNDFVFENDTLKLVYNFNGAGCPVKVTVYNKLNEPLLVNWQKSALIYNNEAISFYDHNYEFKASMEGTSTRTMVPSVTRTNYLNANLDGQIEGKQQLDYIPPGSYISRSSVKLPVRSLSSLLFDTVKKTKLVMGEGLVGNYKLVNFNEMQSPIILKTYLSFGIGKNDKEFALQHKFYVSKAWQSVMSPEDLSVYNKAIDMNFYLQGDSN